VFRGKFPVALSPFPMNDTAMQKKISSLIVFAMLIMAHPTRAGDTNAISPGKIGAAEADKYYGEIMSVTGLVAQVTFRSRIVFINFEKPFPDSPFTCVVFSGSTNQFPNLPSLKGKMVEAKGLVTKYQNKPEIILSNANQLSVIGSPEAGNPFVGGWALTLPGDRPGWLGVESNGKQVNAEMLWVAGSVFKLDGASLDGDKLLLTRIHEVNGKRTEGKTPKIKLTETMTVTRDGDSLKFVSVTPKADGSGEDHAEFTGKRLPPMPPAPDLSQIKFGEPVTLFNGQNLDGWRLVEAGAANGWSAHDGILSNTQTHEEGKPHKSFGNLRTVAEFEDFTLHAETRVPKDGNSGIYIRGIYECQVYDSFGKPLDSHNMGAIYSRIKPTVNAEKAAGEWQTLDITYVQRHATVVLNGVKIIDNQPIAGPTGGALWPEVDRPGPIYLQGDHTGIEYRNLVLRPVVN